MRLEELVEGLPETGLVYHRDSYAKALKTSILRVELDEKRAAYLVLDQTVFHPKSGGQPSDKGFIVGAGFRVEVRKAMAHGRVVVHWGKVLEGAPKPGEALCEIDWGWRYLLMRRHTAGHLLDHCLAQALGRRVETLDSWLGEPCHVVYGGETPSPEELRRAEGLENEMITRGAPVRVEHLSREELAERAPDAPNIARLPPLKSFRVVTIEGCSPIPCGGTHLADITEIGTFSVARAEPAEKGFKLYYDVS